LLTLSGFSKSFSSDIVDGKCQDIARNGGVPFPEGSDPGREAVNHVLDALAEYRSGPVLHAYGNHCLYNLDRPSLAQMLGIRFVEEPCGDLVGYGAHREGGVHFLTLDTYDVAKMRRCETGSLKHRRAVELLEANNPNYPAQENSPEGLKGVARRFVAFNGGVGDVQLEWLRNQLEEVRQSGGKAIILSHQPILPASSSPVCLVWNYRELLACLREFADVIVASFAGHAHKGGYRRDRSGIHFRVFEAALENPHPHKTYAIVDVFDDRLVVKGFGNCKSAVYDFDHTVRSSEREIPTESARTGLS
jgi:manganese-dependent ADP-ribose/CDP-alcohol diphosphatase